MTDLPMPSSRLPASEVAGRSFSTTRRGYDPDEVQAFLELVSAELLSAEKREQELLHELSAAEDRARHPSLDEGMLTTALGQKSAAVLRHAHEEAARITQQAEEAAAGMLRDAQQHATEAEVQAESAAAERIAEAELAANAARQEARDESSAMLESARNEREALIDRAREDGRLIVEQAEEERRQVLTDMARRRRAVTDQIEQFRAARDEIASSVAGVRESAERAMEEMRRADDAAKATAAGAMRIAERGDPADVPGSGGVEAGEESASDADADVGAGEEPGTAGEEPGTSGEEGDAAGAEGDAARAGLGERGGGPSEVAANKAGSGREGPEGVLEANDAAGGDRVEVAEAAVAWEAAVGQAGGEAAGEPGDDEPGDEVTTGRVRSQRRVALRFDDIASVVEPPRIVPRPAHVGDRGTGDRVADDPGDRVVDDPVDVEGLFARLRSREEAVGKGSPSSSAPASAPSQPSARSEDAPQDGAGDAEAMIEVAISDGPVDDAVDPRRVHVADDEAVDDTADDEGAEPEPSPEQGAMARRASALDPIVVTMARRLKRALQDDQNRLLDRLRQGTGEWSDDLLPDEAAQRSQYVKAAAGQVRESLAAGISFARTSIGSRGRVPAPDQHAVDAIADDLSTTVVTLLRRRLEGADGHDVAERVGAAYREWRGERIERLAEDRVIEAFGAGVLSASGRAGGVRWVRNEVDGGCADCEDNELAGRIEVGEKFPTGHRHPPAHSGCRCLVLPTPS